MKNNRNSRRPPTNPARPSRNASKPKQFGNQPARNSGQASNAPAGPKRGGLRNTPPTPRGGLRSAQPSQRENAPERFTSPPKPSPATKRRSRGHIPAQLMDKNRGERLQRVLADAGVASRRACEQLIADGCVTVNNEPVTALPAWVDPLRDRVTVNGRPISIKPAAVRDQPAHCLYLMLNKPRRVITTSSDPMERTSVMDLVNLGEQYPELAGRRLFPVGRLDADSSGLLLLTDDGELTNRLTHPRYGLPKKYLVSIRGHLLQEDVERLREGMLLAHRDGVEFKAGHRTASEPGRPDPVGQTSARDSFFADDANEEDSKFGKQRVRVKRAKMEEVRIMGHERDESRGDRTQLLVTLREGQNREIRRLLARLGHNVRRLRRIALGPLALGKLPVGQWRMLTSKEVATLFTAVGMSVSRRNR